MYVYIQSEAKLWTVGFYKPDGEWIPEGDYNAPGKAAARIHYLNGGSSNDSSMMDDMMHTHGLPGW